MGATARDINERYRGPVHFLKKGGVNTKKKKGKPRLSPVPGRKCVVQ